MAIKDWNIFQKMIEASGINSGKWILGDDGYEIIAYSYDEIDYDAPTMDYRPEPQTVQPPIINLPGFTRRE